MKTVVFLDFDPLSSGVEAIRAAAEWRYHTVALTDRPAATAAAFPHAHTVRQCRLDDLNEIRGLVSRLVLERFELCAILSFSAPYCVSAALLSKEYGMLKKFNGTEKVCDKFLSQKSLRGTDYMPFFRVTETSSIMLKTVKEMPLVLKPLTVPGEGYLAQTVQQYRRVFASLREKYPDIPVIAEKYIDGPQYLAVTLTENGDTRILAMMKQDVDKSLSVTGNRILPNDHSELIYSLKSTADDIIRLFGIKDGPCQLTLRRSGDRWKLTDAAPCAPSGEINALIEAERGVNPARETLKLALGL